MGIKQKHNNPRWQSAVRQVASDLHNTHGGWLDFYSWECKPYWFWRAVFAIACFYFGDLDITKAILYEVSPSLYPTFEKMLKGNTLYIGNMFIMQRENFLQAMEIVWACLQHYLAVVGKDIRKRILQHSSLYLKSKGRGAQVEHQYRFGGSLGERIMSAYIMYHFPNPKTYKIHYTESKARPYRKLQNSY